MPTFVCHAGSFLSRTQEIQYWQCRTMSGINMLKLSVTRGLQISPIQASHARFKVRLSCGIRWKLGAHSIRMMLVTLGGWSRQQTAFQVRSHFTCAGKGRHQFSNSLSCFPERLQERASNFTGVMKCQRIFTCMGLVFHRSRVFKVCLPDGLGYWNTEMVAVLASG